jgi:hypothetical protein
MPTYVADLIYLGNGPDIDPSEGNSNAENAEAILNTPFDGGTMQVTEITFNDGGWSDLDQDDFGGGDTFTYDIGSGDQTEVLDKHVWYDADITLSNGTVLTNESVSVIQAANGDLFLTQFTSAGNLNGQEIEEIELTGINNRFFGAFGMPPHSVTGTTVICFTPGTLIQTPAGETPVEALRPGDFVWTADCGYRPIKALHCSDHAIAGDHAPIQFAPGSIGPNFPRVPLSLSPQHRVLCRSKLVYRMFDTTEVLLPAKRFLGLPGVSQADPGAAARYIHLEVEPHAILRANGALVESCLRGSQVHETLPTILQQSLEPLNKIDACRQIPDGRRQRKLVARMLKNGVKIHDGSNCLGAVPPLVAV